MITCKFENGRNVSLRHVVIDNLILNDNKILLVKRAAHLLNGGKWGIIGGFVERDENIEGATRREILEETGYEIESLQLIAIVDNPDRPNEDRQNISFVHAVRVTNKVGQPDNESTEIKWFDLNELPTKEDFAFDHYQMIHLYLDHLKTPKSLPVIISDWK